MRLFKSLLRDRKSLATRATLVARIESLGYQVVDRRGWLEGEHAERRYFLNRGEEQLGPYSSLSEALKGAKAQNPGASVNDGPDPSDPDGH